MTEDSALLNMKLLHCSFFGLLGSGSLIILPPRYLPVPLYSIPPYPSDQIEPTVLAGQPVAIPWTEDSASCDLDCVSCVLLVLAAHVILASSNCHPREHEQLV